MGMSILPPAGRPDEQALTFAAVRPAMPALPAGAAPRVLQAAWRRFQRADEPRDGGDEARTDLAVEAYAAAVQTLGATGVPGVEVDERPGPVATLRRVRIATDEAAARLGKARGTYSTVEAPGLWDRSQRAREAVTRLVTEELAFLLHAQGIGPADPVLVAGLGNWNATPDSLGPRVVGKLLVTRHLHDLLPPEKRGQLRPVAAIAPGVLGITGIETTELVGAVVARTAPACVIGVDALAAADAGRLCTTVQLSDAGIQPGAGVGNRRKGLNREALGIPVVAIGVPTVIHARRLAPGVGDGGAGGRATGFPALLHSQPGSALPGPGPERLAHLVVTPKEIDLLVEDAAEMVAAALNAALHEGVDLDEVLAQLP